MNDNEEQVNGRANTDDIQSGCDGGSCCPSGSDGAGRSWKTVVFILIVIAAGAVLGRSFIKKSNSDAGRSQQAFASIQADNSSVTASPSKVIVKAEAPVESKSETSTSPVVSETKKRDVPVQAAPSLWPAELDSLASLNSVAADTDAVFVLLAARDKVNDQAITEEIEAAAKTIKADGIRVCAFRLNNTAADYAQIAKQVSVPCVLAMVKGRGMSTVSSEITETKLIQAFVAASRPRSSCCGGRSTSCGPTGPRK